MINIKAELEELRKEREATPVFDETIFEPNKLLYELGFTDEDINDLAEFMRWHINQRQLGLDRKKLIALLRARGEKLTLQRKKELLRELESLKSISI